MIERREDELTQISTLRSYLSLKIAEDLEIERMEKIDLTF